jgi:hypothetical protein
MMGIAIWRLATGYLLPVPGVPPHTPPGIAEALWPIPGSVIALVRIYLHGVRNERRQRASRHA